jgi:pyrroline-5-carboxylate reductase
MKIGIVGCGNLGLSILKGIVNNSPETQVYASKRDVSSIQHLSSEQVTITTDNSELIENSDLIILALKPYTILPFINEVKSKLDAKRHTLVSVASGVSISAIQNALGEKEVGVYRAMPNTATSVNESLTAISASNDALSRKQEVESVFRNLGEVLFIDEQLMDAATILGACGIAYVLRFMRAMIQGGIEVGFDANTATKIVSQTMKGASELIIQNETHPEQEIDKVTTPKGCTIVGLNEMEHAGFSSALIKGIVTSYEKIDRD